MVVRPNTNTRNPHMKHFSCPNYFMIYGPDLCNLQSREKQLIKQSRIETDISKFHTTK